MNRLVPVLLVLLCSSAAAEPPPERTLSCLDDRGRALRVDVLARGNLRLYVGTESQNVSVAGLAATLGAMEASIADWHAGSFIPKRMRYLRTGEIPLRPPCTGLRPIPECQPPTDSSDYLWSDYVNGFLVTRLTLMSDCERDVCRLEEAVWHDVRSLEAAVSCLAPAVPGWVPGPRPNGDGRPRAGSPLKPQK